MKYYILKGTQVFEVSREEFELWISECVRSGDDKKSIADSYLMGRTIRVSTVFLGLDHNFFDRGNPVLFETMIFGFQNDEYQTRTDNYFAALLQHQEAIQYVMDEMWQENSVIEKPPSEESVSLQS